MEKEDHSIQKAEQNPAISNPPTSTERHWVLWFALLVSFLTTIPYIVGIFSGSEDWVFSGFVFGVEDGNSYIANMLSGANGSWLFRTPYTTQPQNGALIFLHYILLGKLTFPAGTHWQLLLLYHLFRIFSIIMVCLATYQFIAFFIPDVPLRRWGLALGTLAGGIGWVSLVFGWSEWLGSLPLSELPGLNMPLALYSPETFGFLSLYGIPHVALARALLLWGVLHYLQLASQESGAPFPWRKGALTGFIWLLALLAQPLTGMVTGAVAGFYLLGLVVWQGASAVCGKSTDWKRIFRAFRVTMWVGIFALPLVVYYIFIFQRNSVMRLWNLQSPLPSPNPIFYLFAYGLMFPFAIYGGVRFIQKRPWSGLLPVSWVLALPILAYAPFNMQRRLVDGIWIALIVLALGSVSTGYVAQDQVESGTSQRLRNWFYGLSSLGFVASIILVIGGFSAALNPSQPLFLPNHQVRTFTELSKISAPGDVVLSAMESGNPLPAFTPQRVVLGIGTLTVGYDDVADQVLSFYQSYTPDSQRQEMLKNWGVLYVFWGPDERKLGGWQPHEAAYLEEVISAGEYAVFRVLDRD